MNTKELERYAADLVAEKLSNKEQVNAHWTVQEIIDSRGEMISDDSEFYQLCAREHVYRVVKKVIRGYDDPTALDDQQMLLEGYEFLKCAYSVTRDESLQILPIDQCSVTELLARAAQYDQQAGSLKRHAEEIRVYVMKRELDQPSVTA